MRIVTDSRAPGEPKDPDDCALFTIFRAFANEAETAAFRQALLDGIGWGEAKQVLYERIEADVAPMRERYEALMADPAAIEAILQQGAQKARAIAAPKVAALREVLGLRAMTTAPARTGLPKAAPKQGKMPRFASFRDADGNFRFRLFSAEGEELLLSKSFADPKAAGALQKQLKALGAAAAVLRVRPLGVSLELDGEAVAGTPDYRDEQARDDALARLHEALDQLAAQE
jgi:tryptophanyl-tRNA synthetase